MATESYVHGLGTCKACGEPLISVGTGDSAGSVMNCLKCEAKKPCMKPGIVYKDPGDAEFKRLLKVTGIPVDSITHDVQKVTPEDKKITLNVVSLQDVIATLKSLPMPKSMKQFKAINKAIVSLEKALLEN